MKLHPHYNKFQMNFHTDRARTAVLRYRVQTVLFKNVVRKV
jgi:hypothetical protein